VSTPTGTGELAPAGWFRRVLRVNRGSHWLTRFVLLRLLGIVYFVAFSTIVTQGLPLLGDHGLLPASHYLEALKDGGAGFLDHPGLFWFGYSDGFFEVLAWLGLLVSLAVALGLANGLALLVLWVLYISFVQIGQTWYSFGWESQLLETGFLAIFLVPFLDPRPFPNRAPPAAVIWLFRWLIFRIMLGAGLIKVRHDPCWRNLTCLDYHFETQPIPGPLSRAFHNAPGWILKTGVVFNHITELIAPWFVFVARIPRWVAGALMLAFQMVLILSGNLSFLNWLTVVPVLACFDDEILRRVLPRRVVAAADRAAARSAEQSQRHRAAWVLFALVAILSIAPVANLLSEHQAMNKSFEPFSLVNTYGAFGSVGKERFEIVFQGTADAEPDESADWREYEFPCKPGSLDRRPCWITPYHRRLDWLLWFAAMSRPERYPWTVHMVWKLLHNDPTMLDLVAGNPFEEEPPRFIRVVRYRYSFSEGGWWKRERLSVWLPPLARDDPRLREILVAYGWLGSP
jgi:hypothetical protein